MVSHCSTNHPVDDLSSGERTGPSILPSPLAVCGSCVSIDCISTTSSTTLTHSDAWGGHALAKKVGNAAILTVQYDVGKAHFRQPTEILDAVRRFAHRLAP